MKVTALHLWSIFTPKSGANAKEREGRMHFGVAQRFAASIAGVKQTSLKLSAKASAATVKLSWKKAKGYKVDAYEVYRANAKNGKYVKLYTTKNAKKRSFTNGRNLQAGKTYYYKVRGVRTVDGKKYYTKWSNISAKKTR